MIKPLSPTDFRADLSAEEIEAISDVEQNSSMHDQINREMAWGMRLQARGLDPNIMFEEGFDPVEYGIERRARPAPKIV